MHGSLLTNAVRVNFRDSRKNHVPRGAFDPQSRSWTGTKTFGPSLDAVANAELSKIAAHPRAQLCADCGLQHRGTC